MTFRVSILLVFCLAVSAPKAKADIVLFEWALNLNGTVYNPGSLAPAADISGFDTATGLGSVAVSFAPGVSGSVLAYFDLELSELTNTFFNEYGAAVGAPPTGLSWEIDEPGFAFGDIYANFLAGALDNSNGVPSTAPEDVAMAMGWTFGGGSLGTVATFSLATTPPASGFYLRQTDPESGENVYLSSEIVTSDVPEPGSWLLLATAAGLAMASLRRHAKK